MIKKIYSIFEEEQRNLNQIFLQMRVFELPSFSAEFTMSWLSVSHSIASMSSQFSFSISVGPIALPGKHIKTHLKLARKREKTTEYEKIIVC